MQALFTEAIITMKKQHLLLCLLAILKIFGLFHLCRYITRKDLRILAYHGGSFGDQHVFRGGLFISPKVFRKRLSFLRKAGYPVLGLSDAIQRLAEDNLPNNSTVITMDDGWYSTFKILAPILKEFSFCSTIYIASYYMHKRTPVFHVAADYALWKSDIDNLDLALVDARLSGVYINKTIEYRQSALRELWSLADSLESATQRNELLTRLYHCLNVDSTALLDNRAYSYMTPAEVSQLRHFDMDVQLHTHRHRLPPESFEATENEIQDNRQALAGLNTTPLHHFCYPSGEYNQQQVTWLDQMNMHTATTANAGFNRQKQPRLALNRYLDWDHFSMLEFEAEMSGFFELVRRCGYKI